MANIAFIGLGNMGGPMSANLVRAGHHVRGFDLSPAAVEAAAQQGVAPASSPAEAVEGAEAVVTMLPKGEHAAAVYLGVEGTPGVIDLVAPGTLLIDSSTIDVETSARLHEAAAAKGLPFVDAPVSGGMSGAQAGTLTFMVGGEPDAVAAATPLLEPMAGNVIPTGGPTTGEAAKICNNMMLFISMMAAQEGAVLARKLGLDAKVFHDIARVSSGESWAMRTWYPVPGITETAGSNNEFAATFSADLAAKDAGLALAGAASVGLSLPAAELVAGQLRRALDEGEGDKDCTIIIRQIDPEAPGLPARPEEQA